ncbi:MAG: hypothetical protein ACJA2J_000292 [Candidatus Azotimanducaceae bacterium]|jgi:hypothetical protein
MSTPVRLALVCFLTFLGRNASTRMIEIFTASQINYFQECLGRTVYVSYFSPHPALIKLPLVELRTG